MPWDGQSKVRTSNLRTTGPTSKLIRRESFTEGCACSYRFILARSTGMYRTTASDYWYSCYLLVRVPLLQRGRGQSTGQRHRLIIRTGTVETYGGGPPSGAGAGLSEASH
eukprot:scaffold33373_cov43-Prasinocladus_malaysianus.AAC.2